jgi:hypothetical protein
MLVISGVGFATILEDQVKILQFSGPKTFQLVCDGLSAFKDLLEFWNISLPSFHQKLSFHLH